ncbi:hypothetical protein MMC07_000437 [Pseudocyphellaria aurata]|nr:hypothetical protein [Pseudocyphellaria aurata]
MAEHDHHLTSRLLRKLRSQENSLYHCACSITHDISFVQTVCDLYPSLPVFANLRCGLWYVPGSQNTCYFKSTDGHTNEWNFSLTRLNLHVAQQAAVYGGCIVVDATRRGKSFPVWPTASPTDVDALVNNAGRAIKDYTGVDCSTQRCSVRKAVRPAVAEEVWDVKLHLPAWIPASEYQQIAGRLPVWTSRLRELQVKPCPGNSAIDQANHVAEQATALELQSKNKSMAAPVQVQDSIEELARKLAKPLRPLWISQASTLQAEFVMQPADLDFTPVILVSASAPERERKLRCEPMPCLIPS